MGLFSRRPAPSAVPEPTPEVLDDVYPASFVNETTTGTSGGSIVFDLSETVATPAPWPSGEYVGRLLCDGYGNLLADTGDHAGYAVFRNPASGLYEFVAPGGQSHNQIHGDPNRVLTIQATTPEDSHHNGVLPDDAHFAAIRQSPDELAVTETGHTAAYTGEGQ